MIDVFVFNASGSAKRAAKMHPETGLIRFEDGSYSAVAGESARGCLVIEAPRCEAPAPVKKPVAPPASPEASIKARIAALEEKKKRLTKQEKDELSSLRAKLKELSGEPKSASSEA